MTSAHGRAPLPAVSPPAPAPSGGLGLSSSCWPLSSPDLGASIGSRAGPWWPGQNPGLEPMGAWKQPECVPGRAWLQVVGNGQRVARGSQLCNQAALTLGRR